jgi:hypothetical protein
MSHRLIFADDRVVELVLKGIVAPRLREIETDLGKRLRLVAHQWTPDGERPAGALGADAADAAGVARVLSRSNIGGDRLIGSVKVLFGGDAAPKSSFSGFLVDFWVELGEVPPRAIERGFAVHHNDHAFDTIL